MHRRQIVAVVVLLAASVAAAQPVSLNTTAGANAAVELPTERPPAPAVPAGGLPPGEPSHEVHAAGDAAESEDLGGRSLRPAGALAMENQPLGSGGGFDGAEQWLRTLGALALVIGGIFVLKWLLRRYGPVKGAAAAAGVIEVLARSPVTPRHQILLVRVGGRLWLVGAGGESLSRLGEITDPEQVADLLGAVERSRPGSMSSSFARALRGWREELDIGDPVPSGEPSPARATPAAGAARQLKGLLHRVRGLGGPGSPS